MTTEVTVAVETVPQKTNVSKSSPVAGETVPLKKNVSKPDDTAFHKVIEII